MAELDWSLEFGSSAACNRSLALNLDMISRSVRRTVAHHDCKIQVSRDRTARCK
jgi:hypothetical protein